MMDFSGIDALALGVTSLLGPYVLLSAEEIAKSVGNDIYNKTKEVFTLVKAKFSADSEASEELSRFSKNPKRYTPIIADILRHKLSEDAEFLHQLQSSMDKLDSNIAITQRVAHAEKVVGMEAESIKSGRATIDQQITEAKDVIGLKVGRLG